MHFWDAGSHRRISIQLHTCHFKGGLPGQETPVYHFPTVTLEAIMPCERDLELQVVEYRILWSALYVEIIGNLLCQRRLVQKLSQL